MMINKLCNLLIPTLLIIFFQFQSTVLQNQAQNNSNYQNNYNQLFEDKDENESDSEYFDKAGPTLDNIIIASEKCNSDSIFSSFKQECQKSVKAVMDYLLAEPDTGNLIIKAEKLRSHPVLHPMAWYSALTMVTFKRSDLCGLRKPSPVEVNPDAFINSKCILKSTSLRNSEQCVLLDEKFGEDNLIENRLWYFREDIQVNSQHWFWHQMNPQSGRGDRHGELFFYFHHSMMARYNANRLSNGFQRVVSFKLANGFVINEGYNPHLTDVISKRNWDIRPHSSKIPESVWAGKLTLNETIVHKDRILKSLDEGTFLTENGQTVPISPADGYEKLGDLTEASWYSINAFYYGGVHSNGHLLMAMMNDPISPNPKSCSVMADASTSMRDPVFYRWHAFIDEISERYKKALPAYKPTTGDFPLLWNGVKITKVEVIPISGVANGPLRTFWSLKNLNLTRRLDFSYSAHPTMQICAKHLDHEPFSYNVKINMEGKSGTDKNATIRIFMAPRYTEDGKRFTMEEQRTLFFVMDSFKTTLKPGNSAISRNSSESTITIPWEQNMANLEGQLFGSPAKPVCGCGWPDHLLLPKGTPSGIIFDIFVMATDANEDNVEEEGRPSVDYCRSVPLLCGALSKKYPDKKPMGYPFDRLPFNVLENYGLWSNSRPLKDLDEYVRCLPNTGTTQVSIVHEDKIRK